MCFVALLLEKEWGLDDVDGLFLIVQRVNEMDLILFDCKYIGTEFVHCVSLSLFCKPNLLKYNEVPGNPFLFITNKERTT